MKIDSGINFKCGKGGTIRMITSGEDIYQIGVDQGYAFWGDVYVNSTNNMSMDLSTSETTARLEYEDETTVLEFKLVSRVPQGKADIEFRNLNPDAWYRLLFNGNLVEMFNGKTISKSVNSADGNGVVRFREVTVPDE